MGASAGELTRLRALAAQMKAAGDLGLLMHRLGPRAQPLLAAIKSAKMKSEVHQDAAEYGARMVDYLPEQIGN